MVKQPHHLLPVIQKAGARASLRSGRLVSQSELLELKVQVVFWPYRLLSFTLALASAWGSYACWTAGSLGWAIGCALLSLLLLLFSLFGVRRTLAQILEGLDASVSSNMVDLAFRAISEVL